LGGRQSWGQVELIDSLGSQLRAGRAVIAAILGGLSIWFTVGEVFRPSSGEYSVTFVTVQVGMALLGVMIVLAIAEAVRRSGSGLRLMSWRGAGRTDDATEAGAEAK